MAESMNRNQRAEVLLRLRSDTQFSIPCFLMELLAIRPDYLETTAKPLVIFFNGTAGHLTELVKSVSKGIGYAFCLLFSVFCHAEELPDPTRPPAIIAIPAATTGRGAPSGLQSIIISKTRRAAIIDGETVELKGKHGDATLIEVSETGVVLQGAQGRQVLTLFPDVRIMQKEIQAAPQLSIKEGGLAQKTRLEARKERK